MFNMVVWEENFCCVSGCWFAEYVDFNVPVLRCMYIVHRFHYSTEKQKVDYEGEHNLVETCWIQCKMCSDACIVAEMNIIFFFLLEYLREIKVT